MKHIKQTERVKKIDWKKDFIYALGASVIIFFLRYIILYLTRGSFDFVNLVTDTATNSENYQSALLSGQIGQIGLIVTGFFLAKSFPKYRLRNSIVIGTMIAVVMGLFILILLMFSKSTVLESIPKLNNGVVLVLVSVLLLFLIRLIIGGFLYSIFGAVIFILTNKLANHFRYHGILIFLPLLLISVLIMLFSFVNKPNAGKYALTFQEKELAKSINFEEKALLVIKEQTGKNLKQLRAFNIDKEQEIGTDGVVIEVKSNDVEKVRNKLNVSLKPMGYLVFHSEQYFNISNQLDEIGVIKTKDQYDILRIKNTAGYNYDVTTEDIIKKLKEWDRKYSLEVMGADTDWFQVKYKIEPKDMKNLSNEVYSLCPDVVEQGTNTVEELAREMKRDKTIYCWWD